jgi:hypothetical protein
VDLEGVERKRIEWWVNSDEGSATANVLFYHRAAVLKVN